MSKTIIFDTEATGIKEPVLIEAAWGLTREPARVFFFPWHQSALKCPHPNPQSLPTHDEPITSY